MSAYNRGSSEEIKLGKRKEIRREDIQEREDRGEVSTCMDGMTESLLNFACILIISMYV